jgi:hypothetical protein
VLGAKINLPTTQLPNPGQLNFLMVVLKKVGINGIITNITGSIFQLDFSSFIV